MKVLTSILDLASEIAVSNREGNLERIDELDRQLAVAIAGGGEEVRRATPSTWTPAGPRADRAAARPGRTVPRASAASPPGAREYPVGASVVTGIGVVSGVECMIVAHDPTVRGGASNPYTWKKVLRAMQIARENRLPTISLVESGGGDLRRQAELFVPAGRLFHDLSALSAAGIPTIALVFGNSTAGGAYVPGMCDYAVMVQNQAKVFLGGPPLVKMATGEEADDESLGGGDMHARRSGLADYLAGDEHECHRASAARSSSTSTGASSAPARPEPADEPLYDAEDLLSIASVDLKVPFDPREVIARIVDGSRFEEYKPLYGTALVHRLGLDPRLSRRHPRQRSRRPLQRGGQEGRRVHPAVQPDRHAAGVPAEHDGLHGRHAVRAEAA